VVRDLAWSATTRGQRGTSEAWSDPFVVPPGGGLTLRIEGTPRESQVHVLVWHEGRPRLAFAPDEARSEQRQRLVGLEGATVRLQLVDRSPRPHVWVGVSEVRVWALAPGEEP